MNWPSVPLQDLVRDGEISYGVVQPGQHVQDGVPIVRVKDLRRGHVVESEPLRVASDVANRYKRTALRGGELLLSIVGSVGETAIVPPRLAGWNVARAIAVLRPEGVAPEWLQLCFQTTSVTHSLTSALNTTVQATLNLVDLRRLRIPMPPERVRIAIAEVLGALDDKIAANTSAVETLLDLDDAEFTGTLRQSASAERLDALASVVKGVSYRRADLAESSTALVTLKSVGRDRRFARRGFKPYVGDCRATQAVKAGDIVVAQTDLTQAADVIGTAVRVPRVDDYERLVASLDLSIVRSTSDVPDEYLLGVLRRRQFRMHCQERMSGTTVLHLGRGAIESYQVPLLSAESMQQIAQASNDRYNLADALDHESAQLVATRDELLPLLMSGKVRVRDAEKIVEEAV